MTGPASLGGSSEPIDLDLREATVERSRHAVMAIAKAHTLFSGAANHLSPEHRALADEAFTLLEEVVRELRDVVARLEGEHSAAEIRAREQQA